MHNFCHTISKFKPLLNCELFDNMLNCLTTCRFCLYFLTEAGVYESDGEFEDDDLLLMLRKQRDQYERKLRYHMSCIARKLV